MLGQGVTKFVTNLTTFTWRSRIENEPLLQAKWHKRSLLHIRIAIPSPSAAASPLQYTEEPGRSLPGTLKIGYSSFSSSWVCHQRFN